MSSYFDGSGGYVGWVVSFEPLARIWLIAVISWPWVAASSPVTGIACSRRSASGSRLSMKPWRNASFSPSSIASRSWSEPSPSSKNWLTSAAASAPAWWSSSTCCTCCSVRLTRESSASTLVL